QTRPQTNGAELRRGRQALGGKIDLRFLRHQINVGKNNNACHGLLHDLRTPARLRAGVIALSLDETELLEKSHRFDESLARTAEGVMIVVAPAQTERVLAPLLDLRRPVPALPITPLLLEEVLARQIRADELDHAAQRFTRHGESLAIRRAMAPTNPPQFARLQEILQIRDVQRRRDKSAIGIALDRLESR